MEFASKIRWAVVLVIVLLVFIFLGWGLASIARNVFRNSGSNDTVTVEEASTLEDSTIDTVRFYTDGPIVASSDHRSYEIEISRTVVSMTVYSEYGQKILQEKSYTNNSEAFSSLLEALDKAKANDRLKGTTTDDDFSEGGACATGRRYVLEIGDDIRRWSTSCKDSRGTMAGKVEIVRDLMNKQIPDFRELTKGTKLSSS